MIVDATRTIAPAFSDLHLVASPGKTGRSSRESIYCPANCRAFEQPWELFTICDSAHGALFVCHYIA